MQRIRPGGQRLVEHAVAADALDADAVTLQVPVEESPADRLPAERCLPRDQDVPVGGVGPCGVPVVEPGRDALVRMRDWTAGGAAEGFWLMQEGVEEIDNVAETTNAFFDRALAQAPRSLLTKNTPRLTGCRNQPMSHGR